MASSLSGFNPLMISYGSQNSWCQQIGNPVRNCLWTNYDFSIDLGWKTFVPAHLCSTCNPASICQKLRVTIPPQRIAAKTHLSLFVVLGDVNSLAPGKFEWNFRYLIFQIITVIDSWGISCELALKWMSLDLTDDKSTLVQEMTWCRKAKSHYLSQCWPRSLSPYGVTRPQWVNGAWSLGEQAVPGCINFTILRIISGFIFFIHWGRGKMEVILMTFQNAYSS